MKKPEPKNKLSQEERDAIIETVNETKYASLPPSQIVPMLADENIYIASESTFYRVLRELAMNTARGSSKPRSTRLPPIHIVSNPNEVWSCNTITIITSQKILNGRMLSNITICPKNIGIVKFITKIIILFQVLSS